MKVPPQSLLLAYFYSRTRSIYRVRCWSCGHTYARKAFSGVSMVYRTTCFATRKPLQSHDVTGQRLGMNISQSPQEQTDRTSTEQKYNRQVPLYLPTPPHRGRQDKIVVGDPHGECLPHETNRWQTAGCSPDDDDTISPPFRNQSLDRPLRATASHVRCVSSRTSSIRSAPRRPRTPARDAALLTRISV